MMAASQGFKNTNLFKKGSQQVPEVTLPEEMAGLEEADSHFADVKGSKTPPSAVLKDQIRDMDRTEEEGNLYSTY